MGSSFLIQIWGDIEATDGVRAGQAAAGKGWGGRVSLPKPGGGSAAVELSQKSAADPAARNGRAFRREELISVFGRDMCVDKNTTQPTSVSADRRRWAALARRGLHSLRESGLAAFPI